MNNITHYNKFWIVLAGLIIDIVFQFTGFDMLTLGIDASVLVSAFTAILVYFVPNYPYHQSAAKN